MQSLRIMKYVTSNSMGGAEQGVLLETRELDQRGHDLLLVCPRGRRLTRILLEQGFNVWRPRTFGKLDPWTLLRLVHVIRSRRIQLIHTHLSTASFLGSLAARICGIPSVATVHGLNSVFCYRFPCLVVAVSEAVRNHLVAQGLPPERIRVVRNGISIQPFDDLPEREHVRRALGFHPEEGVVVYAGRLSPEKGVSLLPEILEQLHRHVSRARLLVLGEGALRADLENSLAKRGLSQHATLVGYQPDIRPYLAAADILLLPSYREGLPRVLLQAMASRLPAVGTTAGGIPEVIKPGETGELAPVGGVEAMAMACAALLKDPQVRKRMGAAARERVEACFSIQRSVTGLENIFSEALSLPLSVRSKESVARAVGEERSIREESY